MERISRGTISTAADEAAKQDGLKIYTVGIGTAEGDLVPLPSDLGAASSRTTRVPW